MPMGAWLEFLSVVDTQFCCCLAWVGLVFEKEKNENVDLLQVYDSQ